MALQQTAVSQFALTNEKKRQVSFSFLAVTVIGILPGFIALIHVNSVFGYYSLKALQVVLFFAFGILFISPKQNLVNFQSADKSRNRMLFVSIFLCISLSILYFFLEKDSLMMAFSSSAAFLLPFVFKLCWLFFTHIPGKEFSIWIPQEKISYKTTVSLDSLLVRIKLTQHVSNVDEKIYTVFIPYYVKLGDFFNHFLITHNANVASSIEHIDTSGNKYAWEFFKTGFYGLQLKRLDPALTMAENKINKDALLYLKRLKQQVKLLAYKKSLYNETIK